MSITHDLTQKISTPGETVTAKSSYSGGASSSVDEPVATGVGDVAIDVTLDLSQIQSLFINSPEDVTITTNGAQAVGTLTLTDNALNNETVTIDSKTYTFQTALTDTDGNVLIGATASDSIDNLIAAITLGSGSGTTYAESTTVHSVATAKAGAGDTMTVTAKTAGTAANTMVSTETMTNGSFGGATLSGGVNIDDTIALKANKPYVWYTGSYFTNILTTDVTKLHVSNSSGTNVQLRLECVYDPTP